MLSSAYQLLFSKYLLTYSKPCQAFKKKSFAKIVMGKTPLTLKFYGFSIISGGAKVS